MAEPPTFALKLAYDGTKFYGTNPQPDRRSVHSEFLRAARKAGVRLANPQGGVPFASRTDRGVSALGNCVRVAVREPAEPRQFVPALNATLEDAAVLGAAPVPASFHPRRALARVYTYHLLLDEAVDERRMSEAAALFLGQHDFSSFSRQDPGTRAKPGAYESTIESVVVERLGPTVAVTIRGSRFWWHMVRRIVPALEAYARDQVRLDDLRRMLDGGPPAAAANRLAPPEPLVLMDVVYEDLAFESRPEWTRPKVPWVRALRQEALAASSFAQRLGGALV
jgi:tRNA pseudouridine38-40 synthase